MPFDLKKNVEFQLSYSMFIYLQDLINKIIRKKHVNVWGDNVCWVVLLTLTVKGWVELLTLTVNGWVAMGC